MALNEKILFSSSNIVENASSIVASRPNATPLDWLRTSSRARQTRFVNPPTGNLAINFFFDSPQRIDYYCIAGHNIPQNGQIAFLAHDEDDVVFHSTGFIDVASLIPAGEFSAGVDPFNTTVNSLSNNMFLPLDEPIFGVHRFRLVIVHGYETVEDTVEVPPVQENENVTIIPDGILRQSDDGVLSIEAENMERRDAGSDSYVQIADSTASNGQRMYKSGQEFYHTANTGPSLSVKFRGSQSGSHKVYVRLKTTDGDSIYNTFDGMDSTRFLRPRSTFVNDQWHWVDVNTINIVAGVEHEIIISARDHFMSVDKMVVIPNGDPAPTGLGPAESQFGQTVITIDEVTGEEVVTSTATNILDIRMVLAGEYLQLHEDASRGLTMSFLTDPDRIQTESGFTVEGKSQKNRRRTEFDLEVMSDRDRREVVQLQQRSNGRPFIVSLYPKEAAWIKEKHLFLATFENNVVINDSFYKHSSTRLVLTEV